MTESTTTQTTTESTTPQSTTESTTKQTTESTTPQTTTESTLQTHEQNILAITLGVVALVIGVLLVIGVITIITLKHRKRNNDLEDDKPLDECAVSDHPSSVEVFDNNRPTPFHGSSTSYPPTSYRRFDNGAYIESEAMGPDE